MKTITELMAGKELGSVKVRRKGWFDYLFFRPYFTDDQNFWHGKSEANCPNLYHDGASEWELYVEKPKTVVLYEWRQFNGSRWVISDVLETELGAAIRWSDTKYKKTGREFVIEGGEE